MPIKLDSRSPGDEPSSREAASRPAPIALDFKTLFEGLPGLYLVLDPGLHVVAATDAYLEATLTRREDILGRHLFDIFPDNPDDPAADSIRNTRASMNRVIQDHVTDAMVIQRHDVRRPESEGGGFEERYWSPVNSPFLNPDGSLAYIIHRVENVTDFVRLKQQGVAQAELTASMREKAVQMEADLYARSREVAESSLELKRANEELARLYEKTRELDVLKNQFFANVSHELRTPLTLILGPVKALAAAENLTEAQRAGLDVVVRNARTLLRTVNDLLDLSKVDAGRMEADFVSLDFAKMARWVASHFESVADDRGIRYEVDLPRKMPGEADPEMLQRVLFNLLANAFKFTPTGGVVRFTLGSGDAAAELVVEDSGPGVPEALREAIFERFRQADPSATRHYGGTGIGLSIVKEFVSLHGGSVAVEDAPQGGARFRVSLPLRAPGKATVRPPRGPDEELALAAVAELRSEPRPAPAAQPPAEAGTVLVVEDNPDMRAFLGETLGTHHRVVTAANGKEGLDAARRLRPDLIVSDLMMPVLSGEQMVEALHADPAMDETPILLLTAKAGEQTRVDQLRRGVQDFLLKPFDADELLARVDGLVARKRRTERRLREQYALLHAVAEGIGDAIFVRDMEGRYRMINTAGARNLGQERPEDVIGRRFADFIDPEEAARVEAYDRQAVADGVGITYEMAWETRHFLISKAPYRDAEGHVVGVLGIARDVTALKRTETELRHLQGKLELRVEQRTADLAAANRELEAFVHTVSHDLQAPLRHITSFSELLEQQAGESLDPKSREYLGRIASAGKRMSAMITDLLGLSRLGRTRLVERRVDLARLVGDVRDEIAPQVEGRIVEFQVAPLPVVRGDLTLLRSAFLNLLSNAVKYSRTRDRARIELGWRSEGAEAVFYVRDNGVGFDPKFQDRLFTLFHRLHAPGEFEGTGVGLACVKRAAERHGGRVWAEGEPGVGATFFLALPKDRLVAEEG